MCSIHQTNSLHNPRIIASFERYNAGVDASVGRGSGREALLGPSERGRTCQILHEVQVHGKGLSAKGYESQSARTRFGFNFVLC